MPWLKENSRPLESASTHDDASFVYVGTACGLAITPDRGKTWTFVDPSPNDPADSVWDVLAQKDGIIDVCGDDGHARSRNGGRTWTLTNSLPSGRCSLAASPDEPSVLFAVVGTQPYESDDEGKHWSKLTNPQPQGRIPFVATNKRAGSSFDLWFGDVTLYRIPCSTPTPATIGARLRCPAASTSWAGPFTSSVGGHDDTAGIVFSRAGRSDNCPILFSSDGGAYLNTVPGAPACHDPKWTQPEVTPHGLWLFSMDGATEADASNEDLYIGSQDDGTFGTRNALAQQPTWTNSDCCDSFVSSASPQNILYTSCCYQPGRYNRLFIRKPGLVGGGEVNTYPAGELPGWESHIVAQFGLNKYAVVTTEGIFITQNINARPIRWTGIGESTTPVSSCGLYVSSSKPSAPMFFVQTGNCDGRGPSAVYRLDRTVSSGTWIQVNMPDNNGGFGVFAVDPHNPARMLASYIRDSEPKVSMISTTDGGSTWTSSLDLDRLMTRSGTFEYETKMGPTDFTSFNGYPQPTLLAFDPGNDDIVVAGGADSGLFLSLDRGQHWEIVQTNGRSVYRSRAVRFAHLSPLTETIFVGSQGSGVWRINLTK